ncbi:hypothetical protein [Clostridium sporogenes]
MLQLKNAQFTKTLYYSSQNFMVFFCCNVYAALLDCSFSEA